ncbi:DUF3667 domain-containing protein [Allomuricauda sp. d1]|uniref:DUF3667 domain-containing protein n=1 Tax=Allomuricauda sp. d1 TaxID=3136725 RepID=UPI0031D1362E
MGKGKELISKGRYELKFRGTECLNCGHPLDVSDKYCPNCSQANSTKRLVLKDFFDEFLSNLINYDSKLLATLYTMLVKPGTITKDYIRGKRISYTNPFRFLLSLAFIYFLMFTYNSNLTEFDEFGEKFSSGLKKTGPFSFSFSADEKTQDSIEAQKRTELALKQLDSLGKSGVPGLKEVSEMGILDNFDSIQAVARRKEMIRDSMILNHPAVFFEQLEDSTGIDDFIQKMDFFRMLIPEDTLKTFSEAKSRYNIKNSLKNRMAFNSANSALKVAARPGTFLNDTLSKLPFVIFFFLPLFAVFIWVAYIRKKYTYTDHLIFSFHNQSLLFILLIISLIVDSIFGTASAGLFILVFAFYLYKAMRKFYGQGRLKTIVKYIFLNTIFTFLAFLMVILLFTGSVFTY